MPRHVRDLDLGAPALGDVLMGRDPSAIGHGMIQDRDRATVRQLDQAADGSSLRQRTQKMIDVFVGIVGECSDRLAVVEQRRSVQPRFTISGDNPYILIY